MNKKVLVANRGEIAIKIIKTLRNMGYSTVSIFSKFDKESLHTKCSDESYMINTDNEVYAYYDVESIIDIAKKCNAIAIHPGIGFLSENVEFAKRCCDEGIVFIGPNEKLLGEISNKCKLKNRIKKYNIKVIDGSNKEIDKVEVAIIEANKIGYPVALKASFRRGWKRH